MEWSTMDMYCAYEIQLCGVMPFAPEIRKGEYVFPVFTDKVRFWEQSKTDSSTPCVTASNQENHGQQSSHRSNSEESRTPKLADASVFVLRVTNDRERCGKSELVTQPKSPSRKDVIGPWNRQWVSINSSYHHPKPNDYH